MRPVFTAMTVLFLVLAAQADPVTQITQFNFNGRLVTGDHVCRDDQNLRTIQAMPTCVKWGAGGRGGPNCESWGSFTLTLPISYFIDVCGRGSSCIREELTHPLTYDVAVYDRFGRDGGPGRLISKATYEIPYCDKVGDSK